MVLSATEFKCWRTANAALLPLTRSHHYVVASAAKAAGTVRHFQLPKLPEVTCCCCPTLVLVKSWEPVGVGWCLLSSVAVASRAMTAAIKSFLITSHPSQCWHQLTDFSLSSCDFLVLETMGDILLYSLHFIYYVRRLWVLLNLVLLLGIYEALHLPRRFVIWSWLTLWAVVPTVVHFQNPCGGFCLLSLILVLLSLSLVPAEVTWGGQRSFPGQATVSWWGRHVIGISWDPSAQVSPWRVSQPTGTRQFPGPGHLLWQHLVCQFYWLVQGEERVLDPQGQRGTLDQDALCSWVSPVRSAILGEFLDVAER